MDGSCMRLKWLLPVGLVMLSTVGCAWLRSPFPAGTPAAPSVLSDNPTLEQVIAVVNGNSSKIRSFSTNGATLSGSGLPSLGASIVFERPGRLRLIASTKLSGVELDLGSNDEAFWFWVKREEPPALYYCRHDQFAASPVRQQLPIDPGLLIEALGINEINPALPQQGPYRHSEGRFSVHTIRETPEGPQTKVTVIEARRGVVVEQSIYDAQRQLVASAVTRSHRADPLTGLTVPKVVDIHCPKAELNLRIDLGNVAVNRPLSGTAEVFAMPQYQGYPPVNLCDPQLHQQPPAARTSLR